MGRCSPFEKDARRLRIIAHRFRRIERVAEIGHVRLLVQAAVWPLWAGLKTLEYCRKDPTQSSSLTQFLDVYSLYVVHNFQPQDWGRFGLDHPANRRRIREYLGERDALPLHRLATSLSFGYSDLHSKIGFDRFAREHQLRAVTIVSQGQSGQVTHHKPWPHQDLMLKPAYLDCGCGCGIELIRFQAHDLTWWSKSGDRITPETIGPYTYRTIEDTTWLLQPYLKNHPTWQKFTNGGLSTCRVVTGRTSASGEPFLIGAFIRFPIGNMIVDNLSQGGLAADIDITNGTMSSGYSWKNTSLEYDIHPDTEGRITGEKVPSWAEVSQLCLDAHRPAGNWRSVGWDVTLTTDGPTLVEANTGWSFCRDTPLGATRWMEVLKSQLGPDLKYSGKFV